MTLTEAPTPRASATVVALLGLAGLVYSALVVDGVPAPLPATAPADEFSADRAMLHLRFMAREARPLGSAHHAEVRDYLIQQLGGLGFETEVQATTAMRSRPGRTGAVPVENVVARRSGTTEGKALLLVAHYDSVPGAPGAGDDGAGVAAILEAVRAASTDFPLRNDVIVLFSDAEELGLYGAQAFVDEHRWADDVGLVLNFEGRGSGGAVILFETSPGNRRLIQEVARAASNPVGDSLSYEIYKNLPNDTDLSRFKEKGYRGLNFAFIEGLTRYHTAIDTVGNLSPATLQHHGSYALSLLRHFGSLDLTQLDSPSDSVYFNVLSRFVDYPASWSTPLFVLATLAYLGATLMAVRKRRLTFRRLLWSLLFVAGAIVVSSGGAWVLWKIIALIHPGYAFMTMGMTYNGTLYFFSFLFLCLAGLDFLARKTRSLTGRTARFWAVLLPWWGLAALMLYAIPLASFLAVWPLLGGTIALFVLASRRDDLRAGPIEALAALAGAAPGIILFFPALVSSFHAFGNAALWVTTAMAALLVLLTAPLLSLIGWGRSRGLAAAALLAALIGLGWASSQSGFSPNRPRPDSIAFAQSADKPEARWISFDPTVDPWTRQFLGDEPSVASVDDLLRGFRPMLQASAEPATLDPMIVELEEEGLINDRRMVKLRFRPVAETSIVTVSISDETEVWGVDLTPPGELAGPTPSADFPLLETARTGWTISFLQVPQEGFDLRLALTPDRPLVFDLREVRPGLPQTGQSFRPRPADAMATPVGRWLDQTTIVASRHEK